MDISGKRNTFWVVKYFVAGSLFLTLSKAIAFPGVSLPPPPDELFAPNAPGYSTGTFTLTVQDTTGHLCFLSERTSQGTFVMLPEFVGAPNQQEITITRSVGEHEFALHCLTKIGPVTRVTVGSAPPPPLDTLAEQLNYQYQVRTGHLNSDGRKDLYVSRTSGGASGNGVLEKVILTQNTSNAFDIVLNPTSSQLNTAGNWPVASNVTTQVEDLNADGFADVMVRDLSNSIAGADDQALYSIGKPFEKGVQAIRAIDVEFQKYFRDTYNWILDPNYFNRAVTASQPAVRYTIDGGLTFCRSFYGLSVCAFAGSRLFDEVFTLARLGLTVIEGVKAQENALANAFGLDSYEETVCFLICYVVYDYNFFTGSEVLLVVRDTFTPITIGPGFDDVNYSLAASNDVDAIQDVFDGGVEETTFDEIDVFAENISRALGAQIGVNDLGEDCDGFSPDRLAAAAPALPVIVGTCGRLGTWLIRTAGTLASTAALLIEELRVKEAIYRVYGGKVGKVGQSWTPEFPQAILNFRDKAGLPKKNLCTKMVYGKLLSDAGMKRRLAKPIKNEPPGYSVRGGGVLEYYFPSISQVSPDVGQVSYGRVVDFRPPC